MRFAPIVKIKKQVLDNLENEMAKLNLTIANMKEDIAVLKQELSSTQKPKSGVISELIVLQRIISAYKQDIESKTVKLNILDFNKIELMQKLKLAHIELEKIKYLEEQEKIKLIKKIKRQEAADLDEVGLILYNNRKAI